ncbi:MAG: DbpA RNA binding domain-containing protein [Bacillota bacterium]
MPGFEDLHLTGAAVAALDTLGWDAADQSARESAPTAARGHNLVIVTPHAPASAAPALAGLLGRLGGGLGGRALLLAPAAELEEWGALANILSREMPLRIQTAHGEVRALRRLRARELDLLIVAPETALALVSRSALKLDEITAVFLAWPESLGGDDVLTPLMQDLPKDAQRIVCTGVPDEPTGLVERYARKAMTVGAPAVESAPPAPAGPVRTVSVPWARRAQALASIVELLDPESLVVWATDRSHAADIAAAIPLGDPSITFTTGDAPKAALIVAFDPPSPARLRQLLSAGDVVLLVPATADAYVARVAAPRRPLRLPGLFETVTREAGARRATIVRAIEAHRPERALLTLAPLFERYDPAEVAASLFDLWVGSAALAATPAAPAAAEAPASSRVFVTIGRNDNATANDFVAILTKDVRVERGSIGRIELKDSFSLVEVPGAEAERIAAALNGMTIRNKRVTARVDRGPARPAGRGGPPPRGGAPRGPRKPR